MLGNGDRPGRAAAGIWSRPYVMALAANFLIFFVVMSFVLFPLYIKEVTIIGSRALTADDINASIELVASGKVDISGFVTTTYPLERAGEAFVEYERNPGRYLRIVIDSGAGAAR